MPRRPTLTCSTCSRPMWSGPGTLPQGLARCQPCRRSDPEYRIKGKRARGVIDTWTCVGCGDTCTRPATKGQRPKWCDACRPASNGVNVSRTVRRSIYERDSWVCWLCEDVVDKSLIGSLNPWRPSLDHVIPRSKGGDESPANLRLAHFWCNAVRCDGRTYSPEDFRVSA